MGRPPSKPKRFKDGFYIEVRNKGADSGMKIWSETREEMMSMADMYRQNKDVVIMGEHKKDRWVDIEPAPRPRGRQKAAPKIEEPDPIDELLGDIDIEALEEVAVDKTEGKSKPPKKQSAPKEEKKKVATSKSSSKAKVKPAPKSKAPAKATTKATHNVKSSGKSVVAKKKVIAKPKSKPKPAGKAKAAKPVKSKPVAKSKKGKR